MLSLKPPLATLLKKLPKKLPLKLPAKLPSWLPRRARFSPQTASATALSATSLFIAANYHAPRAPILLCHGLYGFDKMGPDALPSLQIHYWGGISKALEKLGASVLVARVPRTGNVHQRARELQRLLNERKVSQVNLVAHSMGGLDCRYLISRLAPSTTQVLSLTTISTPHRGSPFMDWCADVFGVGKIIQALDTATAADSSETVCSSAIPEATLQKAKNNILPSSPSSLSSSTSRSDSEYSINQPLQILQKVTGLFDTPAYANLTTDFCKNVFNTQVPDATNVEYLSYGAHYDMPFWAPLRIPYEIVYKKEGPNDGMVSLDSAKWGQYMGTLPSDHWGINNGWLSSKINSQFNALEFYMNHATELWRKGF